MNVSRKTCFGSKSYSILPKRVLQLRFLPGVSNTDSDLCAEDTVVYCVRGRGAVVSEGGNKRQILEKGDFALIPAHAEHQEVNDGDEEVEWIITRSGRCPIVENLQTWSRSDE